ncbi:hypothetical protein KOR42_20910 [Thalassoglobus neptunius]|uniref:Uncharacterized protein n=2 Tax=Thalassoglobus neptunius TaxID=1938619 RepID=A0A5C5X975_9PLAN|nr:hypothetical protein KOR42_20910 [Thalassoglobus neptunius]
MPSKNDIPENKKMMADDLTGKSTSAHPVLILIAGFASAILLLFCCVCGGAAWWFQPEVNEDPERAGELLAEIVAIDIPDTYLPQGTIEWNVAYLMSIRGSYFERFAGDGLLTVVEVDSRFRSEEDVRQHIRDTLLRKGGGGTPLVINDSESRIVEVAIGEELVPFKFEIGRDPPTGRVFHIVEGVFQGKQGEVLLSMRVNEDNWNEQSVIDMLNTIGRLPTVEVEPEPDAEAEEELPTSEEM